MSECVLKLIEISLSYSFVVISSNTVYVDQIAVVILREALGAIGKENDLNDENITFLLPYIA